MQLAALSFCLRDWQFPAVHLRRFLRRLSRVKHWPLHDRNQRIIQYHNFPENSTFSLNVYEKDTFISSLLLLNLLLHVKSTLPLLCLLNLMYLTSVLTQKSRQLIGINPDFRIAVLLGFIKNKLDAEMQMYLINVIDIFRITITGMTHVADDVPGLYLAALLQPFGIGIVLAQVSVVIIAFLVEASDSDAPAAVAVPAQGFYVAGFYGDDGCPNQDIISII